MQLMDLHARNAADLIENAELRRQLEQELKLREAAADELAKLNLELEERVQERTASLTDLLSQMESFSYAISHDLRSPLRSMTGFAEALRDEHGNALNDDARGYLERIIRAGERMNRFINDVLAYARVNRERLDLHPVALGDAIKQVIQHASELQPPHSDIRIMPDLPTVMGNDAFLTQIFANLLGNAVKFVPSGTRPCIHVDWRQCGEFVRVEVADNGIGIPPEYQARLFGLFERLHTGGKFEGTGMGLAIVRRAVERMGGNVGLESDGATGSRFWFTLRLASSAQSVEA